MNLLSTQRARLTALGVSVASAVAAILSGCSSPPKPQQASPSASPTTTAKPSMAPVLVSQALTPRAYRRDAALHLYAKNADRIYHGPLPPLLYAIGVLQVEVDSRGRVTSISWMRAPKHAPEVMAEIEQTVRAAAPFPVPARMGHVTYTDTWLWHRSGTFQLDTLTEGQL